MRRKLCCCSQTRPKRLLARFRSADRQCKGFSMFLKPCRHANCVQMATRKVGPSNAKRYVQAESSRQHPRKLLKCAMMAFGLIRSVQKHPALPACTGELEAKCAPERTACQRIALYSMHTMTRAVACNDRERQRAVVAAHLSLSPSALARFPSWPSSPSAWTDAR